MTTQPKPSTAPPLTERQEARRGRILEATAQLAREGGYDAVQMRAVAECSQVALGTLYRYFPSKIHLLVAVLQDRLRRLHGTLHRRQPYERDPAARVAETLGRAFDALQREPRLADAMLHALTSADRSASAEVEAVSRLTTQLILDALTATPTGPAAQPPPTERQLSAVRVIAYTWHSALAAWLSGRAPVAQVRTDVETVCGLLR